MSYSKHTTILTPPAAGSPVVTLSPGTPPRSPGFAELTSALVALPADHRLLVSPDFSPEELTETFASRNLKSPTLLEWATTTSIPLPTWERYGFVQLQGILASLRNVVPDLLVLFAHEQYAALRRSNSTGDSWGLQIVLTSSLPSRSLRFLVRELASAPSTPYWNLRARRFASLHSFALEDYLRPRQVFSVASIRKNLVPRLTEIATTRTPGEAHRLAHRLIETPDVGAHRLPYEEDVRRWLRLCPGLGFDAVWNSQKPEHSLRNASREVRHALETAPCLDLDVDEARLRLELGDGGLSFQDAAATARMILTSR